MPSQGRRGGSALVAATVALAVCLSLVLNFEVAQARGAYRVGRAYRVGGANGWTYGNFTRWLKGKNFRAGDTLVFKYDAEQYDVVVVTQAQYRRCNAPANATAYHTGNDRFKLVKGHHFFICNIFPWHCKAGMRIAVKAM